MRLLVALLVWFLRAVITSRGSLAFENLALRQQLATCARLQNRRWERFLKRDADVKLEASLTPVSEIPKPGKRVPIELYHQEKVE